MVHFVCAVMRSHNVDGGNIMRITDIISALFFAMFALSSGIALAQTDPSAESVPKTTSKPSTESNNAIPPAADSKMDIETITQKLVYEPVIALAPKLDKCAKKGAETSCPPGGTGHTVGSKIDRSIYKYYITYDEHGVIYSIDNASYDGAGNCGKMDKCVKDALPEKFDIDFSETIKTFPDDVQKYGRFELLYNINSKEISFKHQAPIGSPAQKGERHYSNWVNRQARLNKNNK